MKRVAITLLLSSIFLSAFAADNKIPVPQKTYRVDDIVGVWEYEQYPFGRCRMTYTAEGKYYGVFRIKHQRTARFSGDWRLDGDALVINQRFTSEFQSEWDSAPHRQRILDLTDRMMVLQIEDSNTERLMRRVEKKK